MNPPATPPVIQPPNRRPWLWVGMAVLLVPLVALSLLALGIASYFHLSSDTRAVRNGLLKASGIEWRQQFALNIGRGTFGAVRVGAGLLPLDAEARAAVRAVRGVEVGIYEPANGAKNPDRAAMLGTADTVLNARGWERLVGVLDGEDMVGVYVPCGRISTRQVKCCVLVFDGKQMVVVSSRIDVEPLLEILRTHTGLSAKVRSLAAR